jgi:hypothetical protein
MVLEYELFKNISSLVQKLNCRESVYDLEDHVQEKAPISNWSSKLGPIKIVFLINLLNCLLETNLSQIVFPYVQLSPRTKQNTIRLKKKKTMSSYHIIKVLCQFI